MWPGKGADGGKGHGKGDERGKGGGTFPGYCDHCGDWGHRKSQCVVLDAQMAQYRRGIGNLEEGGEEKGKAENHEATDDHAGQEDVDFWLTANSAYNLEWEDEDQIVGGRVSANTRGSKEQRSVDEATKESVACGEPLVKPCPRKVPCVAPGRGQRCAQRGGRQRRDRSP